MTWTPSVNAGAQVVFQIMDSNFATITSPTVTVRVRRFSGWDFLTHTTILTQLSRRRAREALGLL